MNYMTKETELAIAPAEQGWAFSERTDSECAVICAPVIEENGAEISLEPAGEGVFEASGIKVIQTQTAIDGELLKITRRVENASAETRTFKLIFALRTAFVPTKYLIPCVSYNGNEWGEGLEPKGMVAESGDIWIHSYDRTSIPACTQTETADISVSLFVSAETTESLVSSCALRPLDGGRVEQRIYWPITEAPLSYTENDTYTDRYDTYITLGAGESFECAVYILVSKPEYENYGIVRTLDRALELFPFTRTRNRTCDELWRLGMEFSRSLLHDFKGVKLFSSGMRYAKDKGFFVTTHHEIGWCGQNIMNARMHLLEYRRTGEQALLDGVLAVCDAWKEKQADNGLILSHYEWYTEGREWNYIPPDPNKSWAKNVSYKTGWLPETCNTAWAACEMLKVWDLLREMGIDRPDYLKFATLILDFFCDHYMPEYAFGKGWFFDGKCAEPKGTIGAFVTMALCDGWRILKNERYLEFAKKSLELYMHRDIDNFICTAGAIDCTCVDKETAGPVIISALDLYEFTGDKKYIEWAIKASYYFASWMFVYDVHYGEEAEFTQYGYYTSGSTAVSVQHPALDQWGELMCCEWLRLADITGDERWRERARRVWFNATQLIADENTPEIHGKKRPAGSQNEAFYQTSWGHRADHARGHLNDWLVSWVNVFRLNVIDRLSSVCGYEDTSELE